jgi:DNA (cytosine-5)-methyltransferase 1
MSYKLINYCEIDNAASKSYSRIHGVSEDLNLGDIMKVNTSELPDFDMLVGGSPCQDYSSAGKKAGAMWTCQDCGYQYNPLTANYKTRSECPHCHSTNLEKTRSSLIVEYLRVLHDKMPKFAVYENVKNLLGSEFKATFNLFVEELKDYGYNVYYQVLNAKHYGIPQNRERIILVAIRKDIDNGKFKFPEPFDNGIRLKDLLQKNVDESYYLKPEKTTQLLNNLDETVKKKLYQSINNLGNISLIDNETKENIHQLDENMLELLKDIPSLNEVNKVDVGEDGIRKYSVNLSALKELLTMKREESKLSISEIAEKLNVSKEEASEWFKRDETFVIPRASIWLDLKKLLNIENDTFDKSIMEFIPIEDAKKEKEVELPENATSMYPCAMIACETRTDGMVLYRDNMCGTLRTIDACGDKHIIEAIELPICCASRGRNPENPSARTAGLPTQQRIEININGTTNTLTTVQKDNYILEPCALKYERTEYGKKIRKDYEAGLIDEKIGNMRELSPRKDGICNTLTTVQKDNYIFDPQWFAIRKLTPLESFRLMGFSDEDFAKAKYYTPEEEKELLEKGFKLKYEKDEQGVKHAVSLSTTQAYKQAGNSIVTNVLYEVYKELYKAMPELFDDLKLII